VLRRQVAKIDQLPRTKVAEALGWLQMAARIAIGRLYLFPDPVEILLLVLESASSGGCVHAGFHAFGFANAGGIARPDAADWMSGDPRRRAEARPWTFPASFAG
jgi:hypothetical protein